MDKIKFTLGKFSFPDFFCNQRRIGLHFIKYDIQGCIIKIYRNFTYEVLGQRRRLKATIKNSKIVPQKLNGNLFFDRIFLIFFPSST
jgi:hypothetical protein